MRKLQAILATLFLAGLLTGCIVVERHGGYGNGGYGYWHYDRDRW